MSETTVAIDPQNERSTTHTHAWRNLSRHLTSAGWVVYVRCIDCRENAVRMQPFAPTVVWTEGDISAYGGR